MKKIDNILTHFGDALCTFFLHFLDVICSHVVGNLYNGVTFPYSWGIHWTNANNGTRVCIAQHNCHGSLMRWVHGFHSHFPCNPPKTLLFEYVYIYIYIFFVSSTCLYASLMQYSNVMFVRDLLHLTCTNLEKYKHSIQGIQVGVTELQHRFRYSAHKHVHFFGGLFFNILFSIFGLIMQ